MANDISYFNLEDDSTEYAFNDADAEVKIAQETARATAAEQANAAAISAETSRATAAEQSNATAISAETTRATAAEAAETARAEGVEGTLSNLTTTEKTNLVAAINEVDADVDTLNSKFDGPTWNTDLSTSTIAYTKFAGIVTITNYANIGIAIPSNTWTTLGTLPKGYRPSRRIDMACPVGYNADLSGVIRITSAGNIEIWSNTELTASSAYLSFTVSYPA